MEDIEETKHGSTINPKRTKVTQYVEALVKKCPMLLFVVDMMRWEYLTGYRLYSIVSLSSVDYERTQYGVSSRISRLPRPFILHFIPIARILASVFQFGIKNKILLLGRSSVPQNETDFVFVFNLINLFVENRSKKGQIGQIGSCRQPQKNIQDGVLEQKFNYRSE